MVKFRFRFSLGLRLRPIHTFHICVSACINFFTTHVSVRVGTDGLAIMICRAILWHMSVYVYPNGMNRNICSEGMDPLEGKWKVQIDFQCKGWG